MLKGKNTRFDDLFLFGLVWQYSSVRTNYYYRRFKVMAWCSNTTLRLTSYTLCFNERAIFFQWLSYSAVFLQDFPNEKNLIIFFLLLLIFAIQTFTRTEKLSQGFCLIMLIQFLGQLVHTYSVTWHISTILWCFFMHVSTLPL